jgi:putative protease
MDIQIAKITHYYDKIAVAVIEVIKQPLKVGDVIKISGHDSEFNQTVSSLQVEHEQVKEITKGESGALKTDKPVKEGDVIYLVTKK